jgi:hypothetical protein
MKSTFNLKKRTYVSILIWPGTTRKVPIVYPGFVYYVKGGLRPNSAVDSPNVPGLKIQMARKHSENELNFDERLTEF